MDTLGLSHEEMLREQEEKRQEDFERLLKIKEILHDMGFSLRDDFFTIRSLTPRNQFPLVAGYSDGIRATYSKKGLEIWFTNTFRESSDPEIVTKREELDRRLKEAGLK